MELAHLWDFFWRLSGKRQVGMGANPLTSEEILLWQIRHRIRFTPSEESVIDRLDGLYVQHHNTKES